MHRRPLLFAPALIFSGIAAPARAAAGVPRIVVELFTSQSCSSCPPADDLLARLVATRPDILALSLHVTYWNRLGWRDPFSLQAATDRQRRYAASLGHSQVYTPQLVVQGQRDVVGSNQAAVMAALAAAAALRVLVSIEAERDRVEIVVGAGAVGGQIWLVGFDGRHITAVARGENGGRRLSHTHVVRSLAPVGVWQGTVARVSTARPDGEQVAVLVQAADGAIIGAATAA